MDSLGPVFLFFMDRDRRPVRLHLVRTASAGQNACSGRSLSPAGLKGFSSLQPFGPYPVISGKDSKKGRRREGGREGKRQRRRQRRPLSAAVTRAGRGRVIPEGRVGGRTLRPSLEVSSLRGSRCEVTETPIGPGVTDPEGPLALWKQQDKAATFLKGLVGRDPPCRGRTALGALPPAQPRAPAGLGPGLHAGGSGPRRVRVRLVLPKACFAL